MLLLTARLVTGSSDPLRKLELPVSEALHDEERIPLFDKFKPWLVTMVFVLVLAYTPALIDAVKNNGAGAPRFTPDNPVPVATESTINKK